MIDPKDIIRRYSPEELAETADEYYRRIDDPTPLMTKPFSFLHETPEMLQNLGALLAGLSLGKTMTVLDFGGGTGWLTRFLTQLNCQVICCDVSRAALAIGKRLMTELPLLGTAVYQPVFLPFDCHRIELPTASVDRVICFDAFHHVPNQREVLSEFSRVLRDGGIAGFSEPGRQHSRSPQSQYEMANHRVLENDIDLADIWTIARDCGFTRLTTKLINDMSLSLDDYARIYDGRAKDDLRNEIWNETHNTMFNRAVFFLHKGPLRRDSRSHVGLAHVLQVRCHTPQVSEGQPIKLTISATNTGDATWLHENSEIFGTVRIGAHLYAVDGTLLAIDHSRHALPVSVAPGQSVVVEIEERLPGVGRFRLGFDVVAEGVTWFETTGSQPVFVDVVATR